METTQIIGVRDFKARAPSRARGDTTMSVFTIVAVCVMAPILVIWLLAGFLPTIVPWIVTGTLLLLAIVFLVVGFALSIVGNRVASGVHYEVTPTELRLIGGSVHFTIPLDTITRVYRRDFDLSVSNRSRRGVTGVRLPGLSLADVKYNDRGPLKMCATSSWKEITIIETTGLKYGITPADEEGFKAALGVKG
ncbi:MAG: PH domain-containing protein [Chloroflexota bacterium]